MRNISMVNCSSASSSSALFASSRLDIPAAEADQDVRVLEVRASFRLADLELQLEPRVRRQQLEEIANLRSVSASVNLRVLNLGYFLLFLPTGFTSTTAGAARA